MSIRDLKITPQQIAEKGVIASPDTLTGTPDENKSVFDRLASEIIVPSVNGAIEMLGDVEDDTTEWAADEAQRQANETARQTAEQGRVQAENGRASAETARAQAENARVSAEQGRASAETARVQAEQGRASAETGRVSAEQGRVSAESGRVTAEQQRAAAEDDREDAEDARELAEQQRADETAGIVAQATAQAEAAEDSATLARSWAVGGTGTRSGEDTDNAEYYAGQAGTAAAAALQDAQNAENSAGAASDSADAAAASALAASQDAGSALDSKDAAESAADRAEQAAADAEAIAGGDFIPSSQKGVANGVATLDSNGKLVMAQLPDDTEAVPVTLTAAGWSSAAPYTQTVNANGVLADEDAQMIIPVPEDDSSDAYYSAGVRCTAQAANSLTFICDAKPDDDIALYAIVSSVGNTAGGGGTSGPVLPTPTTGDAGKVPTVNDAEDGYELKTPSGGGGTGGTVSVEVASTTTGEPGTDASVANSGTNTDVKLNFTIPRGATGATGATPNLQIGEVTTLDAGSDATASITGTAENPLLNLGIPKGADGAGGSETWVKIGDYTWSAEDAAAENVPNIFFTQDVEGNPLSFDAVIVECEPLCAANRIMYMLFPDKDNLNQNKNYVFAGSNMLRNGQHEFVRVDLYSSPTPHAISHCNLSGNCKQNGGTQGVIVVWEPAVTSNFIYPANAVRIFPSGQLLEGSKFTVWGRKVNV